MKYDFTTRVKHLDGKDGKEFSESAIQCLLDPIPQVAVQMSSKEKVQSAEIAMKINARPKEVDLTVEEASFVKDIVGRCGMPLLVLQFSKFIDGQP